MGCEHKYWGDGNSNPIADPIPRLEAIIDAASRGARVRLLLDSYVDDGEDLRSNRATADYVNTIPGTEGLDMVAATGNPTGGGIHMKLVLVKVGDETWSAVGSLNGGEVSHKMNREAVLLVDARPVYERLRELFQHDRAQVAPVRSGTPATRLVFWRALPVAGPPSALPPEDGRSADDPV